MRITIARSIRLRRQLTLFVSLAAMASAPLAATGREEAVQAAIETQLAAGFTGVVFVAVDGDVLVREGFGLADRNTGTPMTAETVISSGSISKQVTAAAAVRLASSGALDLDDPLSRYFADVPADKADVTIRQLLSHTGGVDEWVFPHDFIAIPRDEWLRRVFSAPLVHPPGTTYHYSNDGITLVAMIVEEVTGTPFQEHLRTTFFEPLGMANTGWFADPVFRTPEMTVATGYRNGKDDGDPSEWPAPSWALLGNGGILWTLDDMYRWHRALHGDFFSNGERRELFARMTPDPERSLYPSETSAMSYGLGWRIGASVCGDVRIGHTGTGISHNADYRYYRDRDIVIYAASNRIDAPYGGPERYYSREMAQALTEVFMRECTAR